MIMVDTIRKYIKRNPKMLGCFFIGLSLILFVLNFHNSKLSINDLTNNNIQYYAEEIDGLGIDTLQNIVENKPYTDMAQLLKVEGVGTAKYQILLKHFGTNEPCRRGTFLLSVFLMIFFNVLGTCIIKLENQRQMFGTKFWMDSFGLKPEPETHEKGKFKMKDKQKNK